MRILKFRQGSEENATPDLLTRLGAIAERGKAEALSYHVAEASFTAQPIQRVFSTPDEIAEHNNPR